MRPGQIRVFDGLRLTTEHLNHLQEALRSGVQDLREILGLGVVYHGFEVAAAGEQAVTVQPGLAFDFQKNRLVSDEPKTVQVAFGPEEDTQFVCLKYDQIEDGKVEGQFTIIWDSCSVVLRPVLPEPKENLVAIARLSRLAESGFTVADLVRPVENGAPASEAAGDRAEARAASASGDGGAGAGTPSAEPAPTPAPSAETAPAPLETTTGVPAPGNAAGSPPGNGAMLANTSAGMDAPAPASAAAPAEPVAAAAAPGAANPAAADTPAPGKNSPPLSGSAAPAEASPAGTGNAAPEELAAAEGTRPAPNTSSAAAPAVLPEAAPPPRTFVRQGVERLTGEPGAGIDLGALLIGPLRNRLAAKNGTKAELRLGLIEREVSVDFPVVSLTSHAMLSASVATTGERAPEPEAPEVAVGARPGAPLAAGRISALALPVARAIRPAAPPLKFQATTQGEATFDGEKIAQFGLATVQLAPGASGGPWQKHQLTERGIAQLPLGGSAAGAPQAETIDATLQSLQLLVRVDRGSASGFKLLCELLWIGEVSEEIIGVLQGNKPTLSWDGLLAWKALGVSQG